MVGFGDLCGHCRDGLSSSKSPSADPAPGPLPLSGALPCPLPVALGDLLDAVGMDVVSCESRVCCCCVCCICC